MNTNIAILIDDDELVRLVWQFQAKEAGVQLLTYNDPNEVDFLAVNLDTPIYLDSELENGVKGENVAHKLHLQGFQNIYLATGYNPEDFKHLTFLKGVIGKSPPWA
jgi:FixJ family two-component response regulator